MPLDDIKGFPPPQQLSAYKIGIGDELEVKFFLAPELNDRMTVEPDGTISLMFAPHVQAAGLTTAELREALTHALKKHVLSPDMTVVVRTPASRRVVVTGEVAKPGPVQLNGTETIMQVLAEAGWITPSAGKDKVVLLRRGNDGTEQAYPVDISKILDTSDLSQNIVVAAGDTILVPPSDAIEANRWIDRNIRQMMPLNTNANVGYYVNHTVNP